MADFFNIFTEKIIGVLGLLSLLTISWLISYHKRNINFKLILWGLILQIIFGIIILKSGLISFIGMSILGLLIINYVLRDEQTILIIVSSILYSLLTFVNFIFLDVFLNIKSHIWTDPTNYFNYIFYIISFILMVTLFINKFLKIKFHSNLIITLLITLVLNYLFLNNIDGKIIFRELSNGIAYFLDLGNYGSRFLFANLSNDNYMGPWMQEFPNNGSWPGFGFQFAFIVLPTIIFFGGFMSSMYYLGIMQKVITTISKFMKWSMGTSGAETLSCSANIFVGQTEAPLLVKPFLNKMTKSELLTIMVGGFATIAGGVLAGYIAMGVPAGHILAASVMSAPAALVVGKIIYPETEKSETSGNVDLPEIESGSNLIEAATNGITDGLKLAVNVGAMLIGFISLIAIIDLILNTLDFWIDGKLQYYIFFSNNFTFEGFQSWLYYPYEINGLLSPAQGEYSGMFPGSLKTLFGTILKPLAFLIGVPWQDAGYVGNLLGIKLSINEFVAFSTFTQYINSGIISERSIIIASYALCGFANFSSIGIQIGGLSAIAPDRKKDLARIGLKAMIGGAIASWLTATIAGIIL